MQRMFDIPTVVNHVLQWIFCNDRQFYNMMMNTNCQNYKLGNLVEPNSSLHEHVWIWIFVNLFTKIFTNRLTSRLIEHVSELVCKHNPSYRSNSDLLLTIEIFTSQIKFFTRKTRTGTQAINCWVFHE